jgi:hypothetical protein
MNFHDYACARLGISRDTHGIIDVIWVTALLDAMEQGTLSVYVQDGNGRFLWEAMVFDVSQLRRLCRLKPEPRLLWRGASWIPIFSFLNFRGLHFSSFLYQLPKVQTTLCEVEHLWADLDAVEAFLDASPYHYCRDVQNWIVAEVMCRRNWQESLRRAWLAASLVDTFFLHI